MTPATMLLHLGEAMAENERLKSEVVELNRRIGNLLAANQKLALPHPARDHVAEAQLILDAKSRRIEALQSQLTQARERLAKIVITDGEDAGVVLLSHEGPTHLEKRTINGVERTVNVYDHQYFSPLGDALVEIYEGLK